MGESKLLPCPFCGGEAKLCDTGIAPSYYWIYCKGCGCKQPSSIHRESVIKAWNERKPMQEIVERLEELYKYNSEQADIYMGGEGAYMREKKEMYMDRANCYGVAIRTVKEVGVMNVL